MSTDSKVSYLPLWKGQLMDRGSDSKTADIWWKVAQFGQFKVSVACQRRVNQLCLYTVSPSQMPEGSVPMDLHLKWWKCRLLLP